MRVTSDGMTVPQPPAAALIAAQYASWRSFLARRQRLSLAAAAVLLLTLLVAPAAFGSDFTLGRFAVATAYFICAIGLALAFGLAGELVLGHAAIMAIAAYTAGMLATLAHWPAWAAFPAAVVTASAFGFLVMLPGMRVRGWYLALTSLFFVFAVGGMVYIAEPWTGGENGLSAIPAIQFAGYVFPDRLTYALTVICLALVWAAFANLALSQWHVRLQMGRDAPKAAQAVGVDLGRQRLAVYLLSAIPAALAGTLLVYIERFANPASYGISLTLLLLAGVVLGGASAIWGPVLGMGILVGFSFWAGPFSPYNGVFLGLVLLVCTLVFPNGLAPMLRARVDTWLARRAPAIRPRAIDAAAVAPADPRRRWEGDAIARLSGVRKHFGGLQVLAGIDLAIAPGAFCGLIGPNGSGKSTLLNVISGAITPSAGQVTLLGQEVGAWPMHRRAALGVGRTFQTPQLVGEATVVENIAAGAPMPVAGMFGALWRSRASRAADARHLQKALVVYEELGLPPELVCQPAASLPLGLKRIVEIGRALMADPALLLLDEPAVGLNEQERRRLGELLRRLNQSGITVLLVEHNVGFVSEFCSQLVLLETGEVTATARLPGELPQRLRTYLDHSPDRAKSREVRA
ncbi:MAG: ATP-binding cassette domain-containing protein [Pseudomonadota bacterium]